MHTSAIVCEYNPMHNGHIYHINETKKLGATHIVSIMSGSFVQRGEAAIFSKEARTKMALSSGVDLVLELPSIWSMSSAELFAFSSVYIANSLGIIDSLSFGAENESIDDLCKLSDILNSDKLKSLIKENLKSGISFASARAKAVESMLGENYSKLISTPNNILAIEYLKALRKLNSKINPLAIKRSGSSHDSKITHNSYLSAMQLRNCILEKDYNLQSFVSPEIMNIMVEEISAKRAPASIYNLERAILYKLRTLSKQCLNNIADVSEGIENKIYKSALNCVSLDELYRAIKSKRYAMSRIRRIVLSAFLDFNKNVTSLYPQYVRVLGFNSKGLELLKVAKQRSSLPIVTKSSDISNLNIMAHSIFESEARATDVYNLTLPKVLPCGYEFTRKIVKLP